MFGSNLNNWSVTCWVTLITNRVICEHNNCDLTNLFSHTHVFMYMFSNDTIFKSAVLKKERKNKIEFVWF